MRENRLSGIDRAWDVCYNRHVKLNSYEIEAHLIRSMAGDSGRTDLPKGVGAEVREAASADRAGSADNIRLTVAECGVLSVRKILEFCRYILYIGFSDAVIWGFL